MLFPKKSRSFNGKQLTEIVNALLKASPYGKGNDPASLPNYAQRYPRTAERQVAILQEVGLTALEFQELFIERTCPKQGYEFGFLLDDLTHDHFWRINPDEYAGRKTHE